MASWIEGTVDPSNDHFKLYTDDPAEARALVGRGSDATVIVEYVEPLGERVRAALKKELDFYIQELSEPNIWEYMMYHCSTVSNAMNEIHWGYFPAGWHPTDDALE